VPPYPSTPDTFCCQAQWAELTVRARATNERSLIEAARIDGATSWTTLWRILVPTAMPAITTMMVLFFIWSWNEFLLALVLAQNPNVQTLPAGIGLFVGEHTTDYSGLASAALVRFSRGDTGRAVHALAEISELIESGRFSLPVVQTYPLAEIAEAHRVSKDGHVHGNLGLVVGSP
jgi:hypothetical protein